MPAAPREIVIGRGRHTMRLVLDATLEAHVVEAGAEKLAGECMQLENGTVRVCATATDETDRKVAGDKSPSTSRAAGPVYRMSESNLTAVPTGRVFVTLRDEEGNLESHAEALAAEGFEIESVPEYAPHAGWVRPRAGNVAKGLAALPSLEALAFVDRADPQVLVTGAKRPDLR